MADPPGLLPQPQQQDQPWYGGLLDMWKQGYDPAAAYQGDLNSPATQAALRWRALGGMAQAMGRAAMPVPYKGGMPWGSFLGEAAGGAVSGEDALIQARLQNAQAENQRITGLLGQQRLGFMQSVAPQAIDQYLHPEKYTGGGAGGGAGGAGSKPGAASLQAALSTPGAGGSVSPTQLYSFLTDNGASKNEATTITSGMMAESGGNPNQVHDGGIGYGLFGDNGDFLKGMQKFAGLPDGSPVNAPIPWQQQALFALQSLRPGGIARSRVGTNIETATTPEQLTDAQLAWLRPKDWNHGGGNRDQRLGFTSDIYGQPPYQPTTPEQFALGALHPTQTAAAPAAPAEPPMAPSAAPPSLLSPQGAARAASSAAPPQLAPPPAAAPPAAPAPGPQGLLTPSGQAIAQGMVAAAQRGGPAGAQFAGPGAAEPPSAAPPAPVPHTGAAGAQELQGLLNQPPPPPAPAQPAGGPGGPGTAAPAPPMPAAPSMPPPPPSAPPMPMQPQGGPIPGAPTPEQITRAQAATRLFPLLGLPVSPTDAETAKYPLVGPTAGAQAAGTAAAQQPYLQQQEAYKQQMQDYYKAWEQWRQGQIDIAKAGPVAGATKGAEQPYVLEQQAQKAMWDLFVKTNSPQTLRPGTLIHDPRTNTYIGNWEAQGPDGAMHQYSGTLDPLGKIIQQNDLGVSKIPPAQEAGAKTVATKNAEDLQEVGRLAAGANEARTQATFMRQEAPNFYTGAGSAYNQALNKVLLAFDPNNTELANKVKSYESFIKDGGYLVRAQAKEASQKAGVQELKLLGDQMPSEETSPAGLDRTLAQIQGLSDYRLAKQAAMAQYVNQPGRGGWDNNGFEAQFNANISPYTYMYMRMSEADKQEIRTQLSQSKEGQRELQAISDQIGYINKNNLRPGL